MLQWPWVAVLVSTLCMHPDDHATSSVLVSAEHRASEGSLVARSVHIGGRASPCHSLYSKRYMSSLARAIKARESMLPDYPHQAITSLWLYASVNFAAADALLHCLVLRNHLSHIDLGRSMLLHPKSLPFEASVSARLCSIRDVPLLKYRLPGSRRSLEKLFSFNFSGTHSSGARSAGLASANI